MSQYGEYVSTSVEAGIGTIRVDRPKMNPLDVSIQDALGDAARELGRDDAVAAVVVWGGERVFAAGADIKEMLDMSYADMAKRGAVLQAQFTEVARIPKPTVAAIEGYALGAGCELAMTCDFRVAASNAKLGQPEILLGVIPGAGGTQRLTRLVGPAKAKDLVFSGRMVEAEEALRIGLVDELCEPGQAYAAALARVKPYVGGPAIALRAAKEAIDRGLEVDLETGLAIESQLFAGMFATQDRAAGMRSFAENGPGKATFQGR
ncbi:enoyl-CoA hydratase-related protein [Luteipulveratus sp. YIM 133132]|uniref:Enoyl-CoA hydratase-related protein n=1 Tax=Luteipulveratus flavus TaxID=3031728 RepID=A0ABT6C966_9MICO|nr:MULTISPECIES: enoyl-CoA hydratase-related protein [unclassified Luteipulveratus]MDE9366367.1 enoyl-CoA hydratase-related protein [Luteipulveratus sp. YIM 133132]MDF8265456.1 enoyl-CoA hydratase-related protein [Luteipulveratus sp. YIM 133296]